MTWLSQTPVVNQSKEVEVVISKIDEFWKPDWIFSDNEKWIINKLYNKVKTVEWKKQVKDYIDIHYKWAIRTELSDLLLNIESKNKQYWFDVLGKGFEKNESMKEFLSVMWEYIDLRLNDKFSDTEKDKIKLIMVWEIQKILDLKSVIGSVMNDLLLPLKNIINSFNWSESISEKWKKIKEDSSEIGDKFSEVFKNFWLWWKAEIIDSQIDKINKAKINNRELNSLSSVLNVLDVEGKNKSNSEIFDTIKKTTEELAKKLSLWKNLWNEVKKWINSLPFWFWENIIWFLKWLTKDYPILGLIFGLIFWKEFLSESQNKWKKSIKNLEIFSKTDNFPLKENIKSENLEKFNPKKLKVFFKFLDSKKIDYSTNTFWQEFLSWKSKNIEINNLSKLLKNKEWKILLKDEKIEIFVKKLNWLERLENEQQIEKRKKQQTILSKKTEKVSEKQEIEAAKTLELKEEEEEINKEEEEINKNTTLSDEEKKEKQEWLEQSRKGIAEKKKLAEIEKKELEKEALKLKLEKEKLEFENSVQDISSLPVEIEYKWNKLRLDIENNSILLWSKKYEVSIDTVYWNKFENIEFKNWNFILNSDIIITKNQVILLIKDLQEKWSFSLKWEIDKWFPIWIVKYELRINKH